MDISQDTEAVPIPPSVRFLTVNVTDSCNHKCSFCYASCPSKKQADFISRENFRKFIAEAKGLGCELVCISGGEPTLHPDLIGMIKDVKAVGIQELNMITNGWGGSVELFDALQNSNAKVGVSLHDRDPEIHDAVTGCAGSHQRAVSFIKEAVRRGIYVRGGMVVTSQTAGRTRENHDYLMNLGVQEVLFDRPRRTGDALDLKGSETRKRFGPVCQSCANQHLTVGPRGTVHPCPLAEDITVGNLEVDSLSQIVNSTDRLSAVAQIAAESDPDPTSWMDEELQELRYCGANICPSSNCRLFADEVVH